MKNVQPTYGDIISYEFISERKIKSFIAKRFYILKFQKYFLKFDFTLYNNGSGWTITNFTYDDNLIEVLYWYNVQTSTPHIIIASIKLSPITLLRNDATCFLHPGWSLNNFPDSIFVMPEPGCLHLWPLSFFLFELYGQFCQ